MNKLYDSVIIKKIKHVFNKYIKENKYNKNGNQSIMLNFELKHIKINKIRLDKYVRNTTVGDWSIFTFSY